MKKKQISIVFNPHNMGENRKKTMGKHIKKNKANYRHSRNVMSLIALDKYPAAEDISHKIGTVLHAKECSCIEVINGGNTSIVEQFCQPEEAENCQACYRKVILHNGVTDINNVEKYIDFFNKRNVSTELLYRFFVECKAKATIKGNYIEISCHDDRWRISLNGKGNRVDLEHNNYARNFFGERYFTQGYHKQDILDRTLVGALMYIMNYDYNQFHNPKQTLAKNIKKIFLDEFEKAFEEQDF